MHSTAVGRLSRRFLVFALVAGGLILVSAEGVATPFCPADVFCEDNCPRGMLCSRCPLGTNCVPPNTPCGGCGVLARLIEGTCSDITDLSTCAFTCDGAGCKPLAGGGQCEGSEMPFCQGSEMALCMGGVWECDDTGTIGYGCTGTYPPPWCQYGSFCYGNSWVCADNPSTSCTGTPPTCPDPTDPLGQRTKPAICSAGLWYCV